MPNVNRSSGVTKGAAAKLERNRGNPRGEGGGRAIAKKNSLITIH